MKPNKLLWGAVVLLGATVIVLFFLLQRAQADSRNRMKQENTNPIVATIGGEAIRSKDLTDALYQRYGDTLLEQMLDRLAIRLEAESRGIKPTQAEIDAELKLMQQGYDDEEQYYRSMEEQLGMTKEELREDVYYKLMLERIATADIKISDKEIDTYIQKHPEEVKNRVQLHLQKIVSQTLEQAQRTVQLARSGGDFSQLARDRSIDTATANDGGDLGWLEEDDPFLSPALMAAARTLKPGEVSDPVQIEGGFAVVKLIDRKEQSRGSTEQIRQSIRQQLALQQAPPLKDIVDGLRKKRNSKILMQEITPKTPNS